MLQNKFAGLFYKRSETPSSILEASEEKGGLLFFASDCSG